MSELIYCDKCQRSFGTYDALRSHRSMKHASPSTQRKRAAFKAKQAALRRTQDDTPQWEADAHVEAAMAAYNGTKR